jgi:hypothetical protein
MSYEEFVAWVWALVSRLRLTPDQADDLIRQRGLFDTERERIEAEFAGQYAGFVNEDLVVRSGLVALLALAVNRYDGERQIYFEAVPAAERGGAGEPGSIWP